MRFQTNFLTAVALGACLAQASAGQAQTRALSEAECQRLLQRLAEHARLSDGVRRALASQAGGYPAPPAAAARAARAPAGRAEAIRARVEQIAAERQQLEDQRLGAIVRFDLGRAAQIQAQIQDLDVEKITLEKELGGLPAGPSAPSPPQAAERAALDADRIPCKDVSAAYEAAVKIRQRELGAKEGQAGAVPLATLKGQNHEQIARELAVQFAAWPEAATQVGLLDFDGDGRLDGFVDVPAQDAFRLYRQRSDGTVSIEVFVLPGRGMGTAYSETIRRLDEATARQTGRALADLLAVRPAGPVRMLGEMAEFGRAHGHFMAGNFAEAARVEGAAARSTEFQNLRGESVRVLEVLFPVSGGLGMRRVLILSRSSNQEIWEETATQVRPVSYWRADLEVAMVRETRTTTGALVGTRSTTGPIRFSLDW